MGKAATAATRASAVGATRVDRSRSASSSRRCEGGGARAGEGEETDGVAAMPRTGSRSPWRRRSRFSTRKRRRRQLSSSRGVARAAGVGAGAGDDRGTHGGSARCHVAMRRRGPSPSRRRTTSEPDARADAPTRAGARRDRRRTRRSAKRSTEGTEGKRPTLLAARLARTSRRRAMPPPTRPGSNRPGVGDGSATRARAIPRVRQTSTHRRRGRDEAMRRSARDVGREPRVHL